MIDYNARSRKSSFSTDMVDYIHEIMESHQDLIGIDSFEVDDAGSPFMHPTLTWRASAPLIMNILKNKKKRDKDSRNTIAKLPDIKKVIFNDPATIVFWEDGTKTTVKCGEGDIYDKEKGLAMCITKKAMGNTGRYYEIFKKYAPEDDYTYRNIGKEILDRGFDRLCKMAEMLEKSEE